MIQTLMVQQCSRRFGQIYYMRSLFFRRSNKDRKRMPCTFLREYRLFGYITVGWWKIMIDTNCIEWKNIVYRLGGERFYRKHKLRLIYRVVNGVGRAFKQLNDVFTRITRFQMHLLVLFLSVYLRYMSCDENEYGPIQFADFFLFNCNKIYLTS